MHKSKWSEHGVGVQTRESRDADTVAANCVDQDLTRSVGNSTGKIKIAHIP